MAEQLALASADSVMPCVEAVKLHRSGSPPSVGSPQLFLEAWAASRRNQWEQDAISFAQKQLTLPIPQQSHPRQKASTAAGVESVLSKRLRTVARGAAMATAVSAAAAVATVMFAAALAIMALAAAPTAVIAVAWFKSSGGAGQGGSDHSLRALLYGPPVPAKTARSNQRPRSPSSLESIPEESAEDLILVEQ
eukprot:TRINITY_DN42670_c0_g1_i1.p1 TRINITY_DN42670_c0_g1~~TRINITY_DN42670_c0_g1_i1.p1  ORF type:complete len:193 (+),score=43.53 TRINITY_DN42670_c0_g1_i1:86-664(+)